MKITHRDFCNTGNDFKKMCAYIINDVGIKKDQYNWSIGRIVDWKYGLWHDRKYFPNFFRKNAHLWFDYSDGLIGFVISEEGDNMFSIFGKDCYPHLHDRILSWTLDNWSGREGALCTVVCEGQTREKAELEVYGFISKGVTEVTRAFNCANSFKMDNKLEEGYRFVDMKSEYDLPGKIKMRLNAFRNQNEITQLDVQASEYVRESPIYTPEFDLSVTAPDGCHVSGCEAFIDYKNDMAEIERVCTHQDFRRKGFASAVLIECMRRVSSHGISTAYITGMTEGPIKLYGKLGHKAEVNRLYYELEK